MAVTIRDVPRSNATAIQRRSDAGEGQHQRDHFDRERDADILPDDADGLARQLDRPGDGKKVIPQNGHIGRFDRQIRAGQAHGKANGRRSQRGPVIDAIPHHRDLARLLLKLGDECCLVSRQQLGINRR